MCISIRWERLLPRWLLDTNEEINMQIFRLLLAVESLCFVSHGIVLTVSHAIETLVGCSHKQILWLLVFRRRVRTGSSTPLICFGFALRWRFREKIYRTIGSGGNLKDFLSSSFEFSRLLSKRSFLGWASDSGSFEDVIKIKKYTLITDLFWSWVSLQEDWFQLNLLT